MADSEPRRRRAARRRENGAAHVPKQVNPLKLQFMHMAATWGDWRGRFADASLPLVVDVGCGDGAWVAAAAVARPDLNFVGVDVRALRRLMGAVACTATRRLRCSW